MRVLSHRVLCGLALLEALVAGSPLLFDHVPSYFQNHPVTRREVSTYTIQRELGASLSKNSIILSPSDASFPNVTHRWNTLAPPEIEVVVQPARESDIAKIVRYANHNGLDFLVVNTGHGFTTTLGKFKGVQIDMKQLRAFTINPDGKSATLQGGAYNHDIMGGLWDAGYVASEYLYGQYGMVSDNIIHLNVVLADGSEIAVNNKSHADLYWAMRGAGHNFGVVTSLKLKIYPKQISTWHYHNYFWSQDKLETVFEELNKISDFGNAPPKLGVSFGQIYINRTLDADQAILWWTFAYAGPSDEAEAILQPFNEIGALSETQGDVPYPDIIYPQDTAASSCGSGSYVISTMMTQTWNITTERKIYNLFNERIAEYPELSPAARLYYEGYATAGVQAIDSAVSAYPHRDEYHLSFMLSAIPEGADNLVEPAAKWAKDVWDLWVEGQPTRKPATYLNYAVGVEYQTLESIYGYEPWRLERLRALKAKYDPNNSFRFYNPIITE
ncbi:hypothetical protein BKA67DRAFT_528734 [Truncatella angustata]|uniref:FAD-binding PCMH-type domain-containing protein n=1 Tax=Truncatella angustata TaxID=152316 RepID=A0A9P8REH7_9PEZI|nr:uncharacterized protein BKA67DRAFT_528734 [Truncatella angustata]KAH6638611.1 hypothetical protein BKA67DRAFT_528734 [Truncatella angustata]